MKWKDAARELPVLGTLLLCASFILSQGLLGLIEGVEPLWTLILCAALTVCWSLLMFHPRLRIVLAVVAACTLLVGAWALLSVSGSAGGLLRDLGSYLTGETAVKQEHVLFLFPAVCIVVTFYVSVFTVWNLNFPMVTIAELSLFIWRYASAKPPSFGLLAGFMVTCLLYWLLWADKLRAREERAAWRPRAAILLFGLPLSLLCVILAWFLPSPSAPLRDKQAELEAFEFVTSRIAQTQTEDNAASGNVGLDSESSDGGGGGGNLEDPTPPPEPEPEEPPVIPSPFPWLRLASIAALILLLLAGTAAFRLWRRRHWINRLQTLPPETSVPLLFVWLLSMLRCSGFIPGRGETLSEFIDRARTTEYLPATQVETSICAYLPIRYGGRRPGTDERDAMLFADLAVLETVKRRVGHVRYLFFAVLGRI